MNWALSFPVSAEYPEIPKFPFYHVQKLFGSFKPERFKWAAS